MGRRDPTPDSYLVVRQTSDATVLRIVNITNRSDADISDITDQITGMLADGQEVATLTQDELDAATQQLKGFTP